MNYSFLILCALCLLRMAAITTLFSFFTSGKSMLSFLRFAIIIACTYPIIIFHYKTGSTLPIDSMLILYIAAKEIIIGLVIGLYCMIPMSAIESAGYMIDSLRGSTMADIVTGVGGSSTSLYGALFKYIYIFFFFATGGFHVFLTLVYQSYHYYPLLDTHLPSVAMVIHLLYFTTKSIARLIIVFSLPVIIACLLTDVILGYMTIASKEINAFSLTMVIKSLIVVLTIIFSLHFYFTNFDAHSAYFNFTFLE